MVDGYPLGAAEDSNAPFNEEEQVTCPKCNGDKVQYQDNEYSEECTFCDGDGVVDKSLMLTYYKNHK